MVGGGGNKGHMNTLANNDFFCFALQSSQVNSDQTRTSAAGVGRYKYDRERKLGHRRIGEGGQITYKKIETTQLMGSIQLGIQHTVRNMN